MSDQILYATAGNVAISTMSWAEPKDYLTVDPVVTDAQIRIMKDHSGTWVARSAATAPTWADGFLIIPLSVSDTTCKDLMVKIIDPNVTKTYVDNYAILETFGNANAKHFNASQTTLVATDAKIDTINTNTANTKADTTNILSEVQNYSNYKADVSALALQTTLNTVGSEVTTINGKLATIFDLDNGADVGNNLQDIYDAVIAGSGGLTPTQAEMLARCYVFCVGNFSADVDTGNSNITDYKYVNPGEDPDVDTPVFTHNLNKTSSIKSKRTVTTTPLP
jgi:hypothetical protein